MKSDAAAASIILGVVHWITTGNRDWINDSEYNCLLNGYREKAEVGRAKEKGVGVGG